MTVQQAELDRLLARATGDGWVPDVADLDGLDELAADLDDDGPVVEASGREREPLDDGLDDPGAIGAGWDLDDEDETDDDLDGLDDLADLDDEDATEANLAQPTGEQKAATRCPACGSLDVDEFQDGTGTCERCGHRMVLEGKAADFTATEEQAAALAAELGLEAKARSSSDFRACPRCGSTEVAHLGDDGKQPRCAACGYHVPLRDSAR